MRISSTQINDFIACPRAWAFRNVGKEEHIAGVAAAVGSIFHAIQEWRAAYDCFPSVDDLRTMPGNYDSPGALLDRFGEDKLVPLAQHMAEQVGDPLAYFPDEETWPRLFLEYDLERRPVVLRFGDTDVTLGGYMDILAFSADGERAWIGDWKTRGAKSWDDRPMAEDLATNVQLLYYACALLRQHPGLLSIEVGHVNVLRPDKVGGEVKVDVQRVLLPASYLRAWERDTLFPTIERMVEAARLWNADKREQVDTNRDACYRFGRCPHMSACTRIEAEQTILEQVTETGAYNPFKRG